MPDEFETFRDSARRNPDLVRDLLAEHGIEAAPPIAFTGSEDIIIQPGARNYTLTSLYGLFLKARIAPNIAAAALRGIGTDPRAIAEPLSEGEIDAIVEHLAGRGSAEPFDAPAYTISHIDEKTTTKRLGWLVDGIIPAEGLTLLFGLPAQGKSYFAQSFALSVACGLPWLGRGVDRKRRVAYFDWERRGDMFTRRIQALARGMGLGAFNVDYIEPRLALGEFIDQMRELVAIHGYEFIIIDSLSIAIMTADLMAAHEIIPRMFAMHELGVPVLMLDHQKKAQQGQDSWAAGAFGSIFKEAVASCVWQAGKTNPFAFTDGHMDTKLHHRKNNFDLAPEDVCVRLDLTEPERVVRLESINELPFETRIVDELGERGEMSKSEMMALFGYAETKMRTEIRSLLEKGLIEVASEGGGRGRQAKYRLPVGYEDAIPAIPSTYSGPLTRGD